MQVKRYIASDMRRALQQVREELGEDAVILSNKTTAEGVEVIASPHSKEELLQKWGHNHAIQEMSKKMVSETQPVDVKRVEKKIVEVNKAVAVENNSAQYRSFTLATDEIDTLKGEVQLLKDLLKTQMTQVSWGNFNYSQPVTSYLFKQMSILGFSLDIAFDWLEQVKTYQDIQQAWHETLDHLTQRIPIIAMPFAQADHRVIALVGPAGAGKTTTLAKLAAQHILAQGKESVALVTTDTYRIGAQEQLHTIGRIMEVPVCVAEDRAMLDKILTEFSNKSLVLVDTAGLTRHDAGWQEQYQLIKSQEERLQTLLVLPCSHQELVLQRSISDFGNIKLDGCILTKLDESSSLGEIIGIAIKNKLPIAYVTDGLSVSEDIHLANAVAIMRHAINLAKSKNIEEKTMIQLFESYLNKETKDQIFVGV